jgi:hypothetical protein
LSSAFGSRPEVAKGNKPAVVFNATIVETGERLLLATTDSEPFRQPTNKTSPGWRDFTRLYPETDIPVATAARLSATFPFVTPAPRIRRGDVFADQYHLVDGGYYDNYGVATLILAAGFDVMENLTILNLVDPDNPAIPHVIIATIEPAPPFWAVKKWTAVFLLLLPAMRIYSNPGIPSVRRWIGRIAAAFGLLASLLGLCASSSARMRSSRRVLDSWF